MKKSTLLALALMFVMALTAQETVTLKFSSTTPNGSYFPFDVINVTNVTRSWTESLTYPDTTMVLTSYDGLPENIYQEGFISEVYPNPLAGTAYVYFEMGEFGLLNAQVLSINGSVLSEYTEFMDEGAHQIIINMSKPQMAFLVLRTNNNQYIKKILNIDSGSSDNISINKVLDITRNPKTRDGGEFVIGDIMSYMAVSFVGNNMIESNRITQAQYSDETIILAFPITTPSVSTEEITNISINTAVAGGVVLTDGGGTVSARGVCWSTNQNPTISSSHTLDGSGVGSFISSLTGLSSNTTYYVRAYATNETGTAYGNQVTFTTNQDIVAPSVTTNDVSNITTSTAMCGGNVTSSGNGTVSARGVCWSTSQNPTISNSHTSDGTGTGSFTSNLTNLSSNTTYYVRTYATNEAGTAYGNQVTFTTEQELVLATVITNDVSNITTNSATCGGNITSQGNSTVTARGICWSTSQNPTISNNHTFDGMGGGSFTSNMTSLSVNTTYYVRAYATNAAGTAYGEQKTFTTLLHNITTPTVVTNVVTDINSFYATCGGNVTSDGYGTVIDRGVCWSSGPNPSLTFGYHVSCGSGTGSYSVTITALNMNTTYNVRAYATNEAGTSYGSQRTFTTPSLTLPSVSTGDIYDITANSASCNSIVTFNGYGTVSARGVCWSTHENPTIDDYYTLDGDGTGSYTSVMTSLNHNTIYYVRAYVINEYGTAYGNQRMFTTDYVQTWTNGILPGVFSISATQQIHFSQGNLQYQASTETWRFAYNQWDFVGGWDAGILRGNVFENGVQCRNDQVSQTYTGWIDLYGWGSGDIPTVNVSSTISHTYYDWGNNAISNGGNTPNMWRTLTKYEWVYLFNTRSTASGLRYAKATVNDITGVILLPDDWNTNYYSLINLNNPATYFSDNVISATDWIVTFEPNGAVFLPITGYSGGAGSYFYNGGGYYWSASIGNYVDSASDLYFDAGSLNPNVSCDLYPHPRYAVRLVKINE